MNNFLKEVKSINKNKALKEIAIESGISYHTLYSFLRGYVNKLSSKNKQKLSAYLKSFKINKVEQKN